MEKITPNVHSIYYAMMKLAQRDEFYFQDFDVVPGSDNPNVYRIFNYRLASYSDFQEPHAKECRGIMFEIDTLKDTPLRLASRPPMKFFNYNENPEAMFMDTKKLVKDIQFTAIKEDGSLINSYMHYANDTPELRLKSRGSVSSDQCQAAMNYLEDFEAQGTDFYDEISFLTQNGWTVNMEWCSNANRIVLAYHKPQLVIHSIRNNETGNYMSFSDIALYPAIHRNFVQINPPEFVKYLQKYDDFTDILAEIQNEVGKEGYMVHHKDGCFKVKTNWYCSLHHSKDSITNPRRLFECVIDDATDDLRQMFKDDYYAMQLIKDCEEKFQPLYNSMVKTVEAFHLEYKHLPQKEYAILSQKMHQEGLGHFHLTMSLYSNKPLDYKGHFKKLWKKFGLLDENLKEGNNEDTSNICK